MKQLIFNELEHVQDTNGQTVPGDVQHQEVANDSSFHSQEHGSEEVMKRKRVF